MKHAIIITGYPGSGKSTLSKFIEANSLFTHIDYDMYVNAPELLAQKENENNYVIFDGVHFNTERLAMSLAYFKAKGYETTVIYLNTNKKKCYNNIAVRKRPTINIDDLNIVYDLTLLRKTHTFNLIQITDYKLDSLNSRYQIDMKSFVELTNLMKVYENNNRHRNTTRNITESISG